MRYLCPLSSRISCTGGKSIPVFYINWGWQDGRYNAYYRHTDLTPGNLDFNQDKKMITNIRP